MNFTVKFLFLAGIFTGEVLHAYSRQARIFGGSSISIRDRKFMASIHDKKHGFSCGSAIVSTRWVLSALHCIDAEIPLKDYSIRAGSTFYNRGGSFHRVTELRAFNETKHIGDLPYHDIILLRVVPKFRFSRYLGKAKLPIPGRKPPKSLWVTGWGQTSTSSSSMRLLTARVAKVEYDECIERQPNYYEVAKNDTHLCYGGPMHDACFGDSGGPLSSRDTIYGIVSFGIQCAVYPGVYVNVAHYMDWIKENLEN